MWDRHPVRLSLLHMLPAIADQRGVAMAPLLLRGGLPEDADCTGPAIVARAQVCTLLEQFAKRTGEPAIGLDLAEAASPVQLGLAGMALFAGRTLRECLDSHNRQMPDLQGGVTCWLEEHEGLARWHHRFADSDPAHARVLNEGIAGFLARAFRLVTGMGADQLCISLPHRPRAPLRIYEEKLGACVLFGAGNGLTLSFNPVWLDRPNLMSALPQGFGPSAASAWGHEETWQGDDDLIAAIDHLFTGAALCGTLSLVETARSLGLSPRTLQRRLAAMGASFEMQLDIWRRRQAQRALAGSALPVNTLARTLGYGDAAHFIRAFRRWEGCTPGAFRQRVRAAHEGAMAPNGN